MASSPKNTASPGSAEEAPISFLPAGHWTGQGAEGDGDSDSSYGDGTESTASINSTIRHYRTINGRRYHSEVGNAEYWQANDERAQEMTDIYHHVQHLTMGEKPFLAPIKKDIKRALDVGTGTGIWAIDFADDFPDTEVIATDISPIQPDWVPPNLQFQIDDCTQEWTFEPNSFDYIHMRFLAGSIPDWTALFKEAYKCLKPGGYIESMEPSPIIESDDGTVDEKSAMAQWGKIFVEGGRRSGRSWTVVPDKTQQKALEEAGFEKLQVSDFKVPVSGWPKDPKLRELGNVVAICLNQDPEGQIAYSASVLGDYSKEELQVYVAHLRSEFNGKRKHGWYTTRVVVAQKPE